AHGPVVTDERGSTGIQDRAGAGHGDHTGAGAISGADGRADRGLRPGTTRDLETAAASGPDPARLYLHHPPDTVDRGGAGTARIVPALEPDRLGAAAFGDRQRATAVRADDQRPIDQPLRAGTGHGRRARTGSRAEDDIAGAVHGAAGVD